MEQKLRLWDVALRCLCSIALAIMALPLLAVSADAKTIGAGKSFAVDNITYYVNAGNNVVVSGVVDKSTLPGTLTIPATVNYGDDDHAPIDYKVIGIKENAFRDCKNLVDVRIPDFEGGFVYAVAFDGCENLKVVHVLGEVTFINPGRGDGVNPVLTTAKDFGSATDLKFIFHEQEFNFFTSGASNMTNCIFPVGSKAYFPCEFVQDGKSTTVYIAGVETATGTDENRIPLTTPADLCDSSKVDVYCDADKGADSLCPVGSVPELGDGYDSWFVTKKDDASSVVYSNGYIESPIIATCHKSNDISGAAAVAEDMVYLGQEIDPQLTVTTSKGEVLVEDRDYTVSCAVQNDGEDTIAGDNAASGTYKSYRVTATGAGDYVGSCSCEMKVYNYSAIWSRVWSNNEYGNPMAIVSKAISIGGTATSDASSSNMAIAYRGQGVSGGINSSARIIVNAEDYASCLIAESLAGLFDVGVVAVPKNLSSDGLPSEVEIQLASIRNGVALVIGSKEYISDEVKSAVSDAVDGGASRVSGTATDAAQIAVKAYKFMRAVEDGTYSLSLPKTYSTYGSTAMVIPSTEKNSAMFTAAAWAYSNNAAIFFCDENGGLSQETLEALKDTDSTTGQPYFAKVVVPGGSDSAVNALAQSLGDVEVAQWAGSESSIYDSSKLWADEAVKNGSTYKATVFTFADAGWANLAGAACAAGCLGGNLLIADFSNSSAELVSVIESLRYQIGYGIIAANCVQCEPEVYERMIRFWDFGETASVVNLRTSEITVATPELGYTGKALKPTIKVVDKNGKTLVEGTDYTVSYFDNARGCSIAATDVVNPGSYSVVITGTYKIISSNFGGSSVEMGYYKGSRSATFKIAGTVPAPKPATTTPKVTKVSKPGKITSVTVKSKTKKTVKVSWKKKAGATKYQIQWRVKGKSAWKSKTVKSVSVTLKKLTSKKKYQIRVRAVNSAGSGSWSKVKTIKVK